MMVRLIFSLAFVAAVLFFAARLAKRRGMGGHPELIEVLARQQMGRASAVNVIRVADRVFVVGATDAQITVIGEVDDEAVSERVEEATAARQAAAEARTRPALMAPSGSTVLSGSVFDRAQWASLVNSLRDKTVRKP